MTSNYEGKYTPGTPHGGLTTSPEWQSETKQTTNRTERHKEGLPHIQHLPLNQITIDWEKKLDEMIREDDRYEEEIRKSDERERITHRCVVYAQQHIQSRKVWLHNTKKV